MLKLLGPPLLVALLAIPGLAKAQPEAPNAQAQTPAPGAQVAAGSEQATPESTDVDEARAAYGRGLTAAQEVRWDDALSEFETAYALSRVPSALFNVGTTLRALGRYREARDALDRLLQEHELDPETSAEATRIRNEAAARVATLEIRGLPDNAVTLRLDGREVEVGPARPAQIELDPGAHGLAASAEGFSDARWEGQVAGGEVTPVELPLVAIVASDPVAVAAPSPLSETVAESSGGDGVVPAVLTVIGLLILGGAGVGLGFFLQDAAQLRPMQSTIEVRL